jgi:hypothetical protein
MNSKCLIKLPAQVLTYLLTEWIDCSALFDLDTANCSSDSRPSYLTSLRLKGTVFNTLDNDRRDTNFRVMKWIAARGARVRTVRCFVTSKCDSDTVKSFLATLSWTLEDLTVEGLEVNEFVQKASVLCKRLKRFRINGCDGWRCSLTLLIMNCATTLESLTLHDCINVPGLPACTMPRLQRLHISTAVRVRVRYDTAEQFMLQCCPALRVFHCNHPGSKAKILNTLASHCPLLESLSYSCGIEEPTALINVLKCCQHLHALRLVVPKAYASAHALAIVQFGVALQAVSVPAIGEAAFLELIPRLPQLQHLSLFSSTYTSALKLLQVHCGKLKSLELRDVNTFPEAKIAELFSSLIALEVLDLGGNNLTDTILLALGVHCPHLRDVNLSQSAASRGSFTEAGLCALVDGCPALCAVYLGPDPDTTSAPLLRRPPFIHEDNRCGDRWW